MNQYLAKIRQSLPVDIPEKTFHLLFWSLCYGTMTFIASELLQIGMLGTSAGKSAFIIGLNVVFIQIVEIALPEYGTSFCWVIFCAISLSVVGLYFLSGCFDLLLDSTAEESCSDIISYYDLLVFLSMLGFGVCILLGDAGSSRADCIDLSCLSFFITTIFCVVLAAYRDPQTWLSSDAVSSIFSYNSIIATYTGVAEVSAVTLGTLGQMYLSPTRSALLMSLEATTSAILAYFFLHEILSTSEIFGCCLMFSATIISTTHSVDEDNDSSTEIGESSPLVIAEPVNFSEASDFLEHFFLRRRALSRSMMLGRFRDKRKARKDKSMAIDLRPNCINHSIDKYDYGSV